MAMRWVRSSLTLYHQAKLSGFGPALTLGSSIRHGTHAHRRGILLGPKGADGAPGAPPTGSGCQQRKHAFRRALRYRPAREVDRFPTPARRTLVQDGPEAASVRSDWPCRNGSGLMEFERSRCRARAARLSSSRPTFAASPIPLDSRLRLIYAFHATPACAVHFTGPPAE